MASEAKFAEPRVEKAPPLSIVALLHIEDNGDMMANRNAQNGRGDGGGDELIIRGVTGENKIVHGCRSGSRGKGIHEDLRVG